MSYKSIEFAFATNDCLQHSTDKIRPVSLNTCYSLYSICVTPINFYLVRLADNMCRTRLNLTNKSCYLLTVK